MGAGNSEVLRADWQVDSGKNNMKFRKELNFAGQQDGNSGKR